MTNVKQLRRYFSIAFVVLLSTLSSITDGWSKPYALILGGNGGVEEYRQTFFSWGARLKRVLTAEFGFPKEDAVWLAERYESNAQPDGETTLETIQARFERLASAVNPSDTAFVFLIGHGIYLRQTSKFQIPGPDLSAETLNRLLSGLNARYIVIIDASSSSAGFINTLSGPGRIVCTAVKNVNEKNAPEFMEYFLQGLEDGSADLNRDGRISVAEACGQAASLTEAWYTSTGNLATEHALLDDNGDGRGVRLPVANERPGEESVETEQTEDGALAGKCFLKEFTFPPDAPENLVQSYLAILDKISVLKERKSQLDKQDYYTQLEALLIEAATTHRTIRSYIK